MGGMDGWEIDPVKFSIFDIGLSVNRNSYFFANIETEWMYLSTWQIPGMEITPIWIENMDGAWLIALTVDGFMMGHNNYVDR